MKPEAAVCGCVELVSERGQDYVLECDQTVHLCLTGTVPGSANMYNTNVQFVMSTSILI